MTSPATINELLEENERLRLRLEEAEAVVEAIRKGIVDAVVVNSPPGESVYTLEGADRPYRLLVEAMQQGVAVLSPAGVLLYCNPCLADLFKTSVQNMAGCTVDSLAAEADQAMFTDMLEHIKTKSACKEVRLRRQDGTTFPAALTVSVLPLQKFCLLVSDLTQQQHYDELILSKAALLDSETRYRRVFETAKDGILILDTDTGNITDANPFMSELLGYSHEHFLGRELWEIGLFSDKVANEAAVRQLQDTGYIRYEHLPLETNRGRRVEVEVVANAYREDCHKVIQCNIRDITDRSHLEKKTLEQAAVLANLDHRKDEFLAMLSHELRNPLAAITNAVQLLSLQKHEDTLQHQARTIIERQMGQLIRLVDDLLEVSRITSGRIHIHKERIGLNGIVERAVETTRPLMDQHRHELTVSLSPQPIWLHTDASRLEQVIVNLLTNAAKYSADSGCISLVVQQEGHEAVLRVQDQGVGIAPELLPHIFELFTQAEQSLDRSQGGLGIGLCLVQRLVEMHGGKVEAYSVLGQGSEFVVRLPVMMESATQPSSSPEVTAEPISSSLRVLLVDDNVDAAHSLGLLLGASGHTVRAAFDGLSAVEAALDFRPDVVLLDIGLPGIDGYEVAKRMRQHPDLRNVMLVAMTGYAQASDKLRSRNAGFNHHLVKPTDFAKLRHILATVSEKTNGHPTNGDGNS
ncbi:MAG: PAS domain-containing hybrid sensor histidine kinase/response regulator [Pirellulaceae bacterium]